jgi:glucuronate isomerase
MPFITDDFLLQSRVAKELYHEYAEGQPILDHHCHLSAKEIADNRRFTNLSDIWLEGDHYKWRAMRARGISERYCTGDADPYQKFLAWARTVPYTVRNPLYHWTHLELNRYFGIDDLLDEATAPAIWKRCNEMLATEQFTAQGILKFFNVRALCTTDDPAEDLEAHATIAGSTLKTRVYPTFRPDGALAVNEPRTFNRWIDQLASVAKLAITTFKHLLDALGSRHQQFHEMGCRLSDHGLPYCCAADCTEREAAEVFDKVRAGKGVSATEHEQFASYMMLFFGRLDAERGWTKQLHLGALRNVNTRAFEAIGPNTGFDSIGDWPQALRLRNYLNHLEAENLLPKVILYNSNPADNHVFATMAGNFHGNSAANKVRHGSGWWFLDQKEGIESQLDTLSNTGLLSSFIGMVTDSRSFMSYPRHEYFRRVLCNMLGRDMEAELIPNDKTMIGGIIKNICFANAKEFLGLEVPD